MTDNSPSQLDILYQDIHHLEERLFGLSQQVERTQKVVKIDERLAAVHDKHSQAELLEAVTANTELVNQLLRERRREAIESQGNGFFMAQRAARTARTKRNIAFDNRLRNCKQILVPKCPCGEHKGIVFLEEAYNGNAVPGAPVYITAKHKYGTIKRVVDGMLIINTKAGDIEMPIDQVEIVLDKLCPRAWWITQTKLLTFEGKGTKFVNSTPISKYIEGYKLK